MTASSEPSSVLLEGLYVADLTPSTMTLSPSFDAEAAAKLAMARSS